MRPQNRKQFRAIRKALFGSYGQGLINHFNQTGKGI